MKYNGSFNIFLKDDKYNIQSFLKYHPGGVNYLTPYEEKDVLDRMKNTDHSKAAYYLLEEYKSDGARLDSGRDLEKLVNWKEPMLCQVGALGKQYKDWVNAPVDRELRLFGNEILEKLTITPWYLVPIVWIPVICYLIKHGTEKYEEITQDSSTTSIAFYLLLGVILWTLLEYSLHRWLFHIEPSGNFKLMIYIHFAIHGLHHKVPFDTRRLVFPPFPAAIIALVIYRIMLFIVPEFISVLLLAGTLLGYVSYDMLHYYLHYGAPKENSYFYNLKRYHNQHHFAHHDSGFGISSIIWDKIFGTAIKLKHLNMNIRW
ncbi:fatty acid 2-hydroxylase [Rhynchophorus ferrugineus]|uniref:fatty acid 2-hydroxylase n=1 Tax=Rhynchophorus ferrugineus TaxID=354439 RepID=UPI003FCDFC82